MIDKSFLEKVEAMAETKILEIDGRQYTTRDVELVTKPTAAALKIHTLTGLVAFLAGHLADYEPIIHVRSYNEVAVLSPLFGEKQRETLIVACAYDLDHQFGRHIPQEQFIVYLLSMFVQDEQTANIMQVVGNLVQGGEQEFADDGVTQRMTARAGVTRRTTVDVPNPVGLRPFRTFLDIEQPASKFVLRIKADEGKGPQCALFEADGGAWKNQAIATIRDWLTGQTDGKYQIIA